MRRETLPPDAVRVLNAICATFVVPRWRDRFMAKPLEFLERICHCPESFDQRKAVPIAASISSTAVVDALQRVKGMGTATYLGSWSGMEIGDHPLNVACGMVEDCGGSLAARADGTVAFYKSEDLDRFLLVDDAQELARLARAVRA